MRCQKEDLIDAIGVTQAALIRLRLGGQCTEADALSLVLQKMEAAVQAKEEAENIRKKKNSLEAEEVAILALREASNQALAVLQNCEGVGLEAQVEDIARLCDALRSGDLTGAELKLASGDTTPRRNRRKGSLTAWWSCPRFAESLGAVAPELCTGVADLSAKLKAAAKAAPFPYAAPLLGCVALVESSAAFTRGSLLAIAPLSPYSLIPLFPCSLNLCRLNSMLR